LADEIEISLVIPFLNEQEALPSLISNLDTFLRSAPLPSVEVIFVDDGSTDGSAEQLKKAKVGFPSRLIRLSKNFGSHAALRAGILHARGQWITANYADLQDPLDLIPQLYELAQKGSDIVWANRRSTKAKFFERTFSRTYANLVRGWIDPRFPEMGLDIFMMNRKVKHELDQNPESNSSIFLQIMSLGFVQTQLYYDKQQRQAGKSKWTYAKKLKLLIDTFVGFSYVPIRFVTVIGVLMFIVGILWSLGVIAMKILVGGLITGYSTLACIMLIGFGTTNISLGIIAEYLWRTLDATRKRKVFIIDSVTELEPGVL
jgi:glycosyltransferase involved in cell wall biosynthesis